MSSGGATSPRGAEIEDSYPSIQDKLRGELEAFIQRSARKSVRDEDSLSQASQGSLSSTRSLPGSLSGAVVKEVVKDSFLISKAIKRKARGADALSSLPQLPALQREVVGDVISLDDDEGETQASRQGTSREGSLRDRSRREPFREEPPEILTFRERERTREEQRYAAESELCNSFIRRLCHRLRQCRGLFRWCFEHVRKHNRGGKRRKGFPHGIRVSFREENSFKAFKSVFMSSRKAMRSLRADEYIRSDFRCRPARPPKPRCKGC